VRHRSKSKAPRDAPQTIQNRGLTVGSAFADLRTLVAEEADMLIAATARSHGLLLVARNVRDFQGCGVVLLNPFTG